MIMAFTGGPRSEAAGHGCTVGVGAALRQARAAAMDRSYGGRSTPASVMMALILAAGVTSKAG